MISGVHAIIYSNDAEADRSFLGDLIGGDSVDAGGGWMIFALPPAELAVHPTSEAPQHEVYLMCDDILATVAELERREIELARGVTDEGWGLLAAIRLPGGGELGIYQPRHASPLTAFTTDPDMA